MISGLQTFLNRLKYGKHTFKDGDVCYAAPHTNPDGSIGGWVAETAMVESTCWIDPEAEILEFAAIKDEAKILGQAIVNGFGVVSGNAVVDDWAMVTEASTVTGSAHICSGAIICGESFVNTGYVEKDTFYRDFYQIEEDDE